MVINLGKLNGVLAFIQLIQLVFLSKKTLKKKLDFIILNISIHQITIFFTE